MATCWICKFHYKCMESCYGQTSKLMYTDTDSSIYHVTCGDMKNNLGMFDTNSYPKANRFGMPLENKKVQGFIKNENAGRIMTEFVGLRAKMYSLRVEGDDAVKKAKGVK